MCWSIRRRNWPSYFADTVGAAFNGAAGVLARQRARRRSLHNQSVYPSHSGDISFQIHFLTGSLQARSDGPGRRSGHPAPQSRALGLLKAINGHSRRQCQAVFRDENGKMHNSFILSISYLIEAVRIRRKILGYDREAHWMNTQSVPRAEARRPKAGPASYRLKATA
jgi:hypothetical protein